MTLKTEVEAGASGYSITGGRDQGIFVEQVLKDSPAAQLFSLRAGAAGPSPVPHGPRGGAGPRWAQGGSLETAQPHPGWGHSLRCLEMRGSCPPGAQ